MVHIHSLSNIIGVFFHKFCVQSKNGMRGNKCDILRHEKITESDFKPILSLKPQLLFEQPNTQGF